MDGPAVGNTRHRLLAPGQAYLEDHYSEAQPDQSEGGTGLQKSLSSFCFPGDTGPPMVPTGHHEEAV